MEHQEAKKYCYDVVDKFGQTHTVYGNMYQYTAAGDVLVFECPHGIRIETIEDGVEKKKAEMELVARFNEVSGFLIKEVTDAS